MTYYKNKRKPFYQHPFFLGALVGLVLILGMTAGYYFAKATNTKPNTQVVQSPAPAQDLTAQNPSEIAQTDVINGEISTETAQNSEQNQGADLLAKAQPNTDTTALTANASAIIKEQKNSPVVWEMSQQDPTKGKIASNPKIVQNGVAQPQLQAQIGQVANTTPPQPQEQTPSAPVGNQAVLHPEDIPANEYAGISHLQNPTPPTIQPRVKIQSVDKNDKGEPTKSLEIE